MEPVNDRDRSTVHRYRDFAEIEAAGRSQTYHDWALGVADDPAVIAVIDELPYPKRQVNLVFAAARAAGAPIGSYSELRGWLMQHWPAVRQLALTRSTQTNEPARCGVLLPLLAALPQPLALIEVGASAGLCLLPDRYSYAYADSVLHPEDGPSEVVLRPRLDGSVPIPDRMPTIAWRAGLDLNPLDVNDAAEMAWLETLVWPEHEERRRRLRAAIAIARSSPPRMVRSDALDGLSALAAEAPAEATLVIFHSAVLAYFSADDRERFVELVTGLPGHWISNEGISVVPGVGERLRAAVSDPSLFLLAQDGQPRAFADGHGRSLSWIA